MLAAGEIRAAESASKELEGIADSLQAPLLQGIVTRARGSVFLTEGNPRAALDKLRLAWSLFKSIDAAYELAKTRVIIGRACREIGDVDTVEMELDAAQWQYQQLGAAHDLEIVESLIRNSPSDNISGLTPRELEVLRFLTTGKTNKAIAADLFISERTVDRHVSNILSKLNVSSRAAATAYEHDLI